MAEFFFVLTSLPMIKFCTFRGIKKKYAMKKTIPLLILCLVFSTMPGQVTFTPEVFTNSGGGRAVVDMNNDDLDDIVGVTSTNIQIHYQLEAGGFNEVNITTTTADFPASWSFAAADYDGNGYTDLLYGAGSGVTFMRANDTGTEFTEVSGSEFVFSQRSNFVDINNDGHLDAFVCHDVAPNVYYINDGDGNLTFNQGGIGDYPSGGNYGSVWIDYDNDGDQDLFIAKCGGETARRTNQMHKNAGDGTFTEVAEELGLDDPMQTWSSAWADFDNDGDMDVFVGASTGSHKMMINNGDLTFTDYTIESGVGSMTETGTENAPLDLDNDGNIDIVSNGNVLYGNGDMTFTLEVDGLACNFFGDINNDGFMDGVWFNTIYTNDGNSNNWITLTTRGVGPDNDGSNRNGIGARVELISASGMQIRDVRAGEGFSNMSTLNTHFGIGTDDAITSITIKWPSGIVDVIENPAINEAHIFVEGENPVLGVGDNFVNNLIFYPNPASESLNLNFNEEFVGAIYSVYDLTGRRILNGKLSSSQIDVSKLNTGNYILRFVHDGKVALQKFIKN